MTIDYQNYDFMHCLAKDRLDCCASQMIGRMQYCLDIRRFELIAKHNDMRGPERYHLVSSVGKLDTGDPYCVYRLVLFWDGFEILSGKFASGEGIYLPRNFWRLKSPKCRNPNNRGNAREQSQAKKLSAGARDTCTRACT